MMANAKKDITNAPKHFFFINPQPRISLKNIESN